ncbi:hypothetical protein [Microbulbifer sp. ALW1]|uniref:hypothetical protein n=1 Tax=Microbulbifer sp. (strain ALW1) TaxID=1516059 RepID=UPI001356C3F5|nr:hypothetical protein [Microbulbifer sp. ALW1]
MEIIINIVAFGLIGFLGPYLNSKLSSKKYENIENRVFRDVGDKIEITASLGSWPFKPKILYVKKGSVATIQYAGIVSLFFKNKGVVDLSHGGVNPEGIAKAAVKFFPEAEFVRIK